MIKNSQPFGKKIQKTAGGDFLDSHCIKLLFWKSHAFQQKPVSYWRYLLITDVDTASARVGYKVKYTTYTDRHRHKKTQWSGYVLWWPLRCQSVDFDNVVCYVHETKANVSTRLKQTALSELITPPSKWERHLVNVSRLHTVGCA